ncbi:MAG TPA: hypothetical protein VFF06_26930 [Polyangia bacterium]|nr:hypothetical protein [Polyangia bacterium]
MRFAIALLVALAGCHTGLPSNGTPPIGVTPDDGGTLSFAPSDTKLVRFAQQCGVQNPVFSNEDVYSLNLNGPGGPPSGRTAILISFRRTVPINQDVPITLMPFGVIFSSTDSSGQTTLTQYGQSGQFGNYLVTLQWLRGPNAPDSQPLASATLDFLALPQKDGDVATVRMVLVFEDGGVLDQVVSEPLTTALSGCPAG